VIYTFAETNTVQKTLPDGTNIYEFLDGQLEKHFPDGRQEIHYPDHLLRFVSPTGDEELRFPDGTVSRRKAATPPSVQRCGLSLSVDAKHVR
jgi:hypothetical protein